MERSLNANYDAVHSSNCQLYVTAAKRQICACYVRANLIGWGNNFKTSSQLLCNDKQNNNILHENTLNFFFIFI